MQQDDIKISLPSRSRIQDAVEWLTESNLFLLSLSLSLFLVSLRINSAISMRRAAVRSASKRKLQEVQTHAAKHKKETRTSSGFPERSIDRCSCRRYVAQMNQCMKLRDLECAKAVFGDAMDNGRIHSLPAQAFHVLLQLCAGLNAAGRTDVQTAEHVRLHMRNAGLYPDEVSVTAIARARANAEGGEQALHACVADKPVSQSLKLRAYSPAITTLCRENKPLRALHAEAHARADGITLSDVEHASLLRALTDGGYLDEGFALVQRMYSTDLRLIDGSTLLAPLQHFFQTCGWHAALTAVDSNGVCDVNCNIAAQPFDVSEGALLPLLACFSVS